MRKITEKQKTLIIKLKSFFDNKEFDNPLDKVDLNAFTISDASTLIKGLLGMKKCNDLAADDEWIYCSNEYMCALNNVYDTLAKYSKMVTLVV